MLVYFQHKKIYVILFVAVAAFVSVQFILDKCIVY